MTTTHNPAATIAFQASQYLANGGALEPFLSVNQRFTLKELLTSEEGEYFVELALALKKKIDLMPKTGETDAQGNKAVVQLHYFYGGCDWWITERDVGDSADGDGHGEQHQAFGFACLGDPQSAELGYISLPELFSVNAELDLYWEPKTLGEIKAAL